MTCNKCNKCHKKLMLSNKLTKYNREKILYN